MNKIKQLLTIFTITLLMLTFSNINAQTKNSLIPEGYSLEIPQDLKMSAIEKLNNEVTTASKYDEQLGGYVYVTGYVNSNGQAKLDSILVPFIPTTNRGSGCTGGNYHTCAMDCTNRPSEIGVILCTGYCMISCQIR